jgi:hypothetical protein
MVLAIAGAVVAVARLAMKRGAQERSMVRNYGYFRRNAFVRECRSLAGRTFPVK